MENNSYNLEDERRILIQMVDQKKLPIQIPCINSPGSKEIS